LKEHIKEKILNGRPNYESTWTRQRRQISDIIYTCRLPDKTNPLTQWRSSTGQDCIRDTSNPRVRSNICLVGTTDKRCLYQGGDCLCAADYVPGTSRNDKRDEFIFKIGDKYWAWALIDGSTPATQGLLNLGEYTLTQMQGSHPEIQATSTHHTPGTPSEEVSTTSQPSTSSQSQSYSDYGSSGGGGGDPRAGYQRPGYYPVQ
jgi:hypothetical protein